MPDMINPQEMPHNKLSLFLLPLSSLNSEKPFQMLIDHFITSIQVMDIKGVFTDYFFIKLKQLGPCVIT